MVKLETVPANIDCQRASTSVSSNSERSNACCESDFEQTNQTPFVSYLYLPTKTCCCSNRLLSCRRPGA